MNLNESFAVLKVNASMDFTDIRRSYIDLVSVWHPDRFLHNERLRNIATAELKQLNIAYEIIEKYFKINSECASKVSDSVTIVRCVNCGTKNRIPNKAQHGTIVKCGRCRKNPFERNYKNTQ